jgi:hypothetical protein
MSNSAELGFSAEYFPTVILKVLNEKIYELSMKMAFLGSKSVNSK